MKQQQVTSLGRLFTKQGIVLFVMGFAGSVAHARDAEYVPGELIVKYRGGNAVELQRAQAVAHGAIAQSVNVLRTENFEGTLAGMEHLVVETSGSIEDVARQLMASGSVEFAEPNYILSAPERQFASKSHAAPLVPFFSPLGPPATQGSGVAPMVAPVIQPSIADPAQPSADPGLSRMIGFNKLQLATAWQKSVG